MLGVRPCLTLFEQQGGAMQTLLQNVTISHFFQMIEIVCKLVFYLEHCLMLHMFMCLDAID